MTHRIATATAALLATAAAATAASPAAASTSTVTSEPNRDLRVVVSLGCGGTDRDHDGDFNTCGKGDTASLAHAVVNQADVPQSVRVDYALDGPGNEFDRTSTVELPLQPDQIYDDFEEFRVQNNKTPLGTYTLTIFAAGTESVGTSASLTVHD